MTSGFHQVTSELAALECTVKMREEDTERLMMDFSWRLGGKLPGLRGGPETHGCSGGNATDGTGCFSTRMMWRQGGAGEGGPELPLRRRS